jgi:predicted DNA-binding transcriptional regulator AlpA
MLLTFGELPWHDQYKVYEVIQGYFFHFGPSADALDELRRRAECVKAVQRVAKHLGLPDGGMPGVREYERARKELGMGLSSSAIERRWHAWPEVCKAARGERVRMTTRQREQFRALHGHRPKGREWLAGMREWLEGSPPSLRAADYDAWAGMRNEEEPELPPARKAASIRLALGLTWREAIRVAWRDIPLSEAQARQMKALRRRSGGFVSVRGVALIRGFTISMAGKHARTDPTFPAHAFTLHGVRVWRWDDVEAHHEGKPFPKRERGEMQGEVFDSDDIMRLCGLTPTQLYPAIRRRHPHVPQPAGRVSQYPYWLRADVEAWSEQRRAA